MNFNAKNLKGYIIILFSIAYASYTSSLYLEMLLGNLSISIVSATVLSIIAHLYLMEGIERLKKSKFTTSLTIGLILCTTLAYFDLSGVIEKSEQDNLLPIKQQQTTERQQLQQQLEQVQTTLANNAKHTTDGETNWAMYGTFTKSSKQLQQLEQQLEQLKMEHLQQLEQAKNKAQRQQKGLTGLSIALLVLSSLVSYAMVEISQTTQTEEKKKINNTKKESSENSIKHTISDNPTILKTEKKIEQNPVEHLYNHPSQLEGATTEERIALASNYIKQTDNRDHRKISDLFRLNFTHVKQAKILAGLITTPQSSNKATRGKERVIGFTQN